MSLLVISSDWRFKEKFRLRFDSASLREFTLLEKLLGYIKTIEDPEGYCLIADEKLGKHTQKQLLSELQGIGNRIPVYLFLDKGHTGFSHPKLPFPILLVRKEGLNYQTFFQQLDSPSENDDQVRERKAYIGNLLLGESKCMQAVRHKIKLVAQDSCPVLLTGETGTGKELAATAIHRVSGSPRKPIIINCSLLDGNLGEDWFFGHAKGAFTDGRMELEGLVEQANGTTLFLDEVENLSITAQANLLRILETGEFRRLGDPKIRHSRFRLISASNRNLAEEVKAHTFRQDLFYRLDTFLIRLPPLREHSEDIPMLANSYLRQHHVFQTIPEEEMRMLCRHSWPGNVRQLFSVLKRSSIENKESGTLHITKENLYEND